MGPTNIYQLTNMGGTLKKMTIETFKMAMADPKSKAYEVANRLGITTTTLYAYVNGDGSVKEKHIKRVTS